MLVYCRSGNRSKTASSTLAELGYTNLYEFGGINTWPYETERKGGQRLRIGTKSVPHKQRIGRGFCRLVFAIFRQYNGTQR